MEVVEFFSLLLTSLCKGLFIAFFFIAVKPIAAIAVYLPKIHEELLRIGNLYAKCLKEWEKADIDQRFTDEDLKKKDKT